MMVWRLIWCSLANRRATALLTVLAVAASVALLLVVEKVRTGARESFADTISGTDLLMGALFAVALACSLGRIYFSHSRMTVATAMPRSSASERW